VALHYGNEDYFLREEHSIGFTNTTTFLCSRRINFEQNIIVQRSLGVPLQKTQSTHHMLRGSRLAYFSLCDRLFSQDVHLKPNYKRTGSRVNVLSLGNNWNIH